MRHSTIILTGTIVLWAASTTWTQQSAPSSSSVLQEQRRFMLQARSGQSDVEPATMLARVQVALVADSRNSELYRALGDVELLQSRPVPGSVPDFAVLAQVIQRASSAYARAIEIDPTNAVALSSHGLLLVFSSFVTQRPELLVDGVRHLNRAVELRPSAVVPRLNRAFTGVNLQAPLRDTEKTVEDLKFLITVAEGSRPGDMVHLLLGDVYAETGRIDEARGEYQAAARRPASAAREQAAARITALEKGTLPTAEIAAMRGSLASNCTMCHGN